MKLHPILLPLLALVPSFAACVHLAPDAPSTEPRMVAAAQETGDAMLALEGAMLGLGLLTDVEPGRTPAETFQLAGAVINATFHGCAVATPLAGGRSGLRVQFAAAGCGLPDTGARFRGALALELPALGGVGEYRVAFERFAVGGDLLLDGSAAVRFVDRSRLSYRLEGLGASVAGHTLTLDSRGDLTSGRAHTVATFDAVGSVTLDGVARALDVRELQRDLVGDCYPQRGAVTLDLPAAGTAGLRSRASVTFDDSEAGLDSDDTGLVWMTVDGRRETVQLPARACAAL